MKWYGAIGFSEVKEDSENPSVYKGTITERFYKGEIFNHTIAYRFGEGRNKDLSYSQSISILADPYALEFYSQILYIVIDNVKWSISRISIEYPRIKLDIGEVYNDERGIGSSVAGVIDGY